ncbi:MAG: hypothetical protein H6739_40750 [Alphaproteobacteria bacterium]|nr:hypothetical protein [Alphaproteobacteria bacterium]
MRRALTLAAVPALLFAALAGLAVLGPGDDTTHFFWNRVAARLGWPLVLGAVAASAAALLARRPLPWIGAVVLGYAPYAAMQQFGIDTALYAEYALRGAREGLLEMLLRWPEQVWGAADGHLHRHLPLVPWIYAAALKLGLPFRAVAGLWAAAMVWGTLRLGGDKAAAMLLAVPLLWPGTGQLLTDAPLTAAVAFGLAGLLQGRWWWALPAFAIKISAGLFLLGPLVCLVLQPWRGRGRAALTLVLGLVAVVALFGVVGHRVRPLDTYLGALRSLLVQETPWLLAAAAWGLWRDPDRRRAWLLAAALGGLAVVLRYAPAGHAARYALPLVPVMATAAAAAVSGRVANALAAFGLVLGLGAWRPLAVHHQSANLSAAIADVPDNVDVIDLWGDYPDQPVPPDFLAPLVQLEVDARVQYRGRLDAPVTLEDRPQGWWNRHALDPWYLQEDPADAMMILVMGDARPGAWPGWRHVATHDRYLGSSFAFPSAVLLFVREDATSSPDNHGDTPP